GDIPPALSPLDAFAAQGRLLAKQLDDSKKNGRRISRLPPLTIANTLAHGRPQYLRSITTDADGTAKSIQALPGAREDGLLANKTEFEAPDIRPKSFYPRLSGAPPDITADTPAKPSAPVIRERPSPLAEDHTSDPFYAPRTLSPEPLPSAAQGVVRTESPATNKPKTSLDLVRQREGLLRGLSSESVATRGSGSNSLAPPRSPFGRHASSIRSVPPEGSDDEYAASIGASFISAPRKLSESSGLSGQHGSASPSFRYPSRSPSVASEYSIGASHASRPTFNFSRPISRASRPSLDMTSRKASSESQPYIFTDDTVHTPPSVASEEFVEALENQNAPAPSYIHTRFSLPRGRVLQRNSIAFQDVETHQYSWEQPIPYSNVIPAIPGTNGRPPSPPSPPSVPALTDQSPTSPEYPTPDDSPIGGHTGSPKAMPKLQSHPSSRSAASGSTIKARSPHSMISSVELSAEDHLAKGIECHERGSVKESTYHLRIAAKRNNPTAMLLYALACRHGWGMRPNQKEGVQWLRKAADSASLEVADDEDTMKDAKPGDLLERKTRRAQFALSIYELGISHMNGWGIEQDKALALRCFEIAGAWGDSDALAEAGFCYAQGVGCKKDLKKSAKFYRLAEAKGVSMIGNSWIYKSKYMDSDGDRSSRSVEKDMAEKPRREKSRSRAIF
ncbi:MAG: hypothetical protein M1835_001886, partial [Candelina submexicana]